MEVAVFHCKKPEKIAFLLGRIQMMYGGVNRLFFFANSGMCA